MPESSYAGQRAYCQCSSWLREFVRHFKVHFGASNPFDGHHRLQLHCLHLSGTSRSHSPRLPIIYLSSYSIVCLADRSHFSPAGPDLQRFDYSRLPSIAYSMDSSFTRTAAVLQHVSDSRLSEALPAMPTSRSDLLGAPLAIKFPRSFPSPSSNRELFASAH